MKRIKNLLVIVLVLAMLFTLVACNSAKKEEPKEEAETQEAEESTTIANPWSDADTLDAAVEGARLKGFTFDEGMILSLGEVVPAGYRYMEKMVEIEVPIAAVEMTIRKGMGEADISGDYNTYANEWTVDVDGTEVTCFGNREGEATKTIWQTNDGSYSILAYGAGGDADFGLNAEDLAILVKGIK